MLWYLIGFALGAGLLGGAWWAARRFLGLRFSWRGTEWLVGVLALAVAAGCVAAPVGAAPRGRPDGSTNDAGQAQRPGHTTVVVSDGGQAPGLDGGQARGPAPTGSAADPVHVYCAALDALAVMAAKDAAARAAVAAPSVPSVPSVLSTPAKPAGSLWGGYFWRRAGFAVGAVCGAGAFGAAWWLFLKRKASDTSDKSDVSDGADKSDGAQ